MNIAKRIPVDDDTPLALFDAAQTRQSALLGMLHLLAGARDLGAPSAEVMGQAFAGLELLAGDAERLYQAARSC